MESMNDPEPNLSWQILCERSRNHAELTEEEQNQSAAAFADLARIFDNKFFDAKHPLFWMFHDRSGWRCRWAIWFSQLLKSISGHCDFKTLIRDLQKSDLYGERMTILNIVDILRHSGFSFKFDPEIAVSRGPKKPDLYVQLSETGLGFFVEVTTLSPSANQREADETFHAITEPLFQFIGRLEYCGHIERVMANMHLREVLPKILSAANKAAEETGFETIEINGVLKFAFATQSNRGLLNAWADKFGFDSNCVLGPGADVPEFTRIAGKLKKESFQLPIDQANVVVIYSHLFATPPTSRESLEWYINRLEDEVFKHSHVGYLIVIFSWIGSGNGQIVRLGDHLCVNRQRFHFESDTAILIKNRFATKPMASLVEEAFRNAFIKSAVRF